MAWLLIAAAMSAGCGPASRTRPAAEPLPSAAADPPPVAPSATWKPIGYSVERRPLLVAESGSGPLRIYLVGGVHGDETEGRSALEHVKNRPAEAATIRILRDLNPDGTAAYRRHNARGRDLNRNWPARNFNPGPTGGSAPLSEPETRALERDLRVFKPHLVIVLHSISIGPLVNYDGPAARLATAFAGAARTLNPDWHVRPVLDHDTSGSLGSYLGIDRQLPILTVEFKRGQDEAAAAAALRRGLAAVARAAEVQDQGGEH